MNPFDLPGREFLAFYVVFGITCFAFTRVYLQYTERSAVARLPDCHPVQAAWLRGCEHEALRVTILSLLDRGLLKASGSELKSAEGDTERVRLPLERAVLAHFAAGRRAESVLTDPSQEVSSALVMLETDLEKRGLWPTPQDRTRRASWRGISLSVVLGVGAIKVLVALSRSRSNVVFLFVLAALFVIVDRMWTIPETTRGGQETLAQLRALCAGLKSRADQMRLGKPRWDKPPQRACLRSSSSTATSSAAGSSLASGAPCPAHCTA